MKPTKHSIAIVMAAALSAVFILSACGGSGASSVDVSMREFSFTPEGFTVQAGSTVTLTMRNLGALEHNIHLMELGYVVEDTWTDEDLQGEFYGAGNVPGGDVSTVTFTAPTEPGDYQVLCSVPSHLELGMDGTMTVTE